MVNSCAVPYCTNRHSRESDIRFYRLPLKNPKLLKEWLRRIRCKSIPVNQFTRVCSEHFEGNPQRIGPNDIPCIFAWSKKSVPRPTRGRVAAVSDRHEAEQPTSDDVTGTTARNSESTKQPGTLSETGNLGSIESLLIAAEMEKTSYQQNNEESTHDHLGLETLSEACELHQNNSELDPLRLETLSEASELHQKENEKDEAIKSLENQLKWYKEKEINSQNIKRDKQKLKFFTGFVNEELFDICFDFITYGQLEEEDSYSLSLTEQFLLVLMRLRLGLTEQYLAYTFSISIKTVSRIFLRWIPLMYRRFKLLDIWPSKDQIVNAMSMSIALKHPSLRVIIDCTEIKISQPKGPGNQQITYSSYKNSNTAKGLVGIAPTGAISFISELYGGNISDRELTIRCGILDLLQNGDELMADRGFAIEDLTKPRGIKLNIPAFTNGRSQLEPHEVTQSRRIANTRIHVERAIGRVKEFKILTHILSTFNLPYLNEIFFVCCMLTNFQEQLIK